jgi:hypothetical protein
MTRQPSSSDRGGAGSSAFLSVIDLLLAHGADERLDGELVHAFAAHEASILASAGKGDGAQVRAAEAAVRRDPRAAFTFDEAGAATLSAAGRTWRAGRFTPLSIGQLRTRAARSPTSERARVRLWVLDGASPATDIGSLQGNAGGDALFQVASQFNCLEAPSPRMTSVESYFDDYTQGPRASISAFPGTLLRHYSAPDASGGRFVQTNDGRQIELLADVCDPGMATVRNGYLLAKNVTNPKAFIARLEERFDMIRVGVHDDVDAVLGYDWDGAVNAPPSIAQVFTSTVAGGGYGDTSGLVGACQQLLRAAYLGTLLAAAGLGRGRVVLTLIGGGAFGNSPRLIWEAILWAIAEAESAIRGDLDVIINGRNLGEQIDRPTIVSAVRERGGAVLTCPRGGPVSIQR